ncbi:GGDEF domain-containing protein [Geodermatophilus sp. SYSU D01105]
MEIPASLRARQPRSAARSGAVVMVVSGLVLAVTTTVGPNGASLVARSAVWASVALLLGAALGCLLLRPDRLDRSGAFPLIGISGVLLVCGLNTLTSDPSAAAQAFLAFPVLWSAAHLRRWAVVLVTGAAVVLDGATLLHLVPVEAALTDLVFFGAVLVVVAAMLVRAGETNDALVRALQQQATVDGLTGLVTRRVLDEALAEALEGAGSGAGTALVLVDVDSFKQINDAHGHPVGDDALVHLAGVIRRQVRAGDAVVGRLGGDELAVLLPGCVPETATRRAGELLEAVRATPLTLPDGTLLALSVSVGVAHAPRDATRVRELYAAADAALYRAKRGGRGRVEVAPGPA